MQDTIRGGIAQLSSYTYAPDLLMYGMLCVLLATGMWLLLATYWEVRARRRAARRRPPPPPALPVLPRVARCRRPLARRLPTAARRPTQLPVSTTHSVVGAVVGMSIVAGGVDSVNWSTSIPVFPYLSGMSVICLSWVTSPIIAGIFAAILFLLTRHLILRRKNSYEKSLWSFPVLTFVTFFVITYFIIKKGGPAFGWSKTADSKAAWISAWIGLVFSFVSMTLGIHFIRYRVEKDQAEKAAEAAGEMLDEAQKRAAADALLAAPPKRTATPEMLVAMRKSRVWRAVSASANTDIHDFVAADAKLAAMHATAEVFDDKTENAFKYLQVFTACANSFAHGSNDVANAIGPFAAIYGIWECSCVTETAGVPSWILAMGGAGLVIGLATYGYKIMAVLGVKMTKLTNSRGYCVELAAAATVILGSRFGLPLSTTHSLVGAVTGVGLLERRGGFNAVLLVKFFCGWVATIIIAGCTSAAFTAQGVYSPLRSTPDPTLAAINAAAAAAR